MALWLVKQSVGVGEGAEKKEQCISQELRFSLVIEWDKRVVVGGVTL